MNVLPYLYFDGRTAEALDFYKGAIGANVSACYVSDLHQVTLTSDADIGTIEADFDDSADPTGCNATKPTGLASR